MRFTRLWVLVVALACCATVAKAQNFCGPNTVTYYRVDSNAGGAVMCVLFVNRDSFTFYAQGTEHGQSFRLLGYSLFSDVNPSSMAYHESIIFNTWYATINGNGEQFVGVDRGVVNTHILATGSWDEKMPPNTIVHHMLGSYGVWLKYEPGRQTSEVPTLRPIRTCGAYLKTFYVDGHPDEVRCLLGERNDYPKAWLGAGSHSGKQYLHIGTAFFGVLGTKWGAADICLPDYICGRVNFGGLNLSSTPSRGGFGVGTIGPSDREPRLYDVSGSWNEKWVIH